MKHLILTLCCILATGFVFAHEGHGPSLAELRKQAKQGKICIANKHGHSLGAYIEHEGKSLRCVKARKADLTEQKELVWVELVLQDGKLVTAPQ